MICCFFKTLGLRVEADVFDSPPSAAASSKLGMLPRERERERERGREREK